MASATRESSNSEIYVVIGRRCSGGVEIRLISRMPVKDRWSVLGMGVARQRQHINGFSKLFEFFPYGGLQSVVLHPAPKGPNWKIRHPFVKADGCL